MSLSIRVPNTLFTKSIAQLYPIPESARLISILGGGAESIKNIVLDSQQSTTIVGTPTFASNYLSVKAGVSGYLDTNLIINDFFTFFAVVRDVPDSANIMHTQGDSGQINSERLGTTGGTYRFDVEGNNGALNASRVGWKLIVGTVSPTQHVLTVYTNGSPNSTVYDRAIVMQDGLNVRVGGFNSSDAFDVAMFGIYDKGLDQQEVSELYQWAEAKLKESGVILS